MGKSYRHTPIMGNAADSEKEDKRLANRKFRRVNKVRIRQGEEPIVINEAGETWTMAKDGRHYFDKDARPELMRK